MKTELLFVCTVSAAALLPIGAVRDAHACGGCFVQQSESTQVSGHRMALSISSDQTTLWDQITYEGEPSEFAWVLPIKGQVQIGVSSDLLFEVLEQETSVQVYSPQINCTPPSCPGDGEELGAGATAGTGMSDPGVDVIAQEVVGPYDTVQLEASDPMALTNWLATHGYNVPADVQPVIAQYVNEGFGFLAIRLVPGQGIDAMRPVRITSPGASPVLPLRMVAAGTGAFTPITLWVIGEGRYEPQNFTSGTVRESDLVWDWSTQSSNYASLADAVLKADGSSRWLLEAGEPKGTWALEQLIDRAGYDPEGSGYADETGENAVENAIADVETLLAGIDQDSLWVSRMSANLARSALGRDLVLGASSNQTELVRAFFVQNTIGDQPSCPPAPVCDDGSDDGWEGVDYEEGSVLGPSSCGLAPPGGVPVLAFAGLAGAAWLLARRRRERR